MPIFDGKDPTQTGVDAAKKANQSVKNLREELSNLSYEEFLFICVDACTNVLTYERLHTKTKPT